MRLNKLFVFAVALTALVATGCNKDEENESDNTPTPVAQAIAKSYDGIVSMTVGGTSGEAPAQITIAVDGQNSAIVTLPAYGEGQMALMECAVKGVNVTKNGDNYTLTKENFEETLTKGDGTTIVYSGSINGTVSGGRLNMTYGIKPGAMPMTINFTFEQEQ